MFGITLNEARELFEKKILLNRMSTEYLSSQMIYNKKLACLLVNTMRVSKKKIELIQELNKLYETQLNEFSDIRQDQCVELYNQLNELDRPTPRTDSLNADLSDAKEKMLVLVPRINVIESQIPNKKILTSFYIRPTKEENQIAFAFDEAAKELGPGIND